MRQKTLDVLEFNKIKALIANETISDLGREKYYNCILRLITILLFSNE